MEWIVISQAARLALAALRERKLIRLLPDAPGNPSHWEATALGAAVYSSGMDPGDGMLLYERFQQLQEKIVLACNAHLIYALLAEPLFEIFDWSKWHRILQQLHPMQRWDRRE
jgi:hypothetical protein